LPGIGVVKAAAVSDYRPKEIHKQKVKKQPGDLIIEMERTTDILQSLGEQKQQQFLVGFAAETENPEEYGRDKLKKKHLDAIVINNVADQGAGFAGDTNIVTYLNKSLESESLSLAAKADISKKLWELIIRDMKDESS
jgi:phosphopantothenoylcysteine decarboxylase/phosphopantothenate--cysteine ligase